MVDKRDPLELGRQLLLLRGLNPDVPITILADYLNDRIPRTGIVTKGLWAEEQNGSLPELW